MLPAVQKRTFLAHLCLLAKRTKHYTSDPEYQGNPGILVYLDEKR